ncbi:hypothetical protein AB0D12_40240 [Streptomyces sp. NPDC048479]|uniref:hypothetical protein n=1 Tax=Streptomyces sp. NPDC048479 TaxID=3154725 RepID=UPI00344625B3
MGLPPGAGGFGQLMVNRLARATAVIRRTAGGKTVSAVLARRHQGDGAADLPKNDPFARAPARSPAQFEDGLGDRDTSETDLDAQQLGAPAAGP